MSKPATRMVLHQQTIIRPDEHVFIGGRTGSGKTWTARKYLPGYPPVIVLDTKGKFSWPEIPREQQVTITRLQDVAAINFKQTPYVVYKPRFEELNFDWYNAFFRWVYFAARKGLKLRVLVDEAWEVAPNPAKIPDFYRACLTRGREWGIGVWSCSQRPSGIPQVILSEATHIFAHDLNLPQDRDKIHQITGAPETLQKPGGHAFWYWQAGWERAVKAELVEGRR